MVRGRTTLWQRRAVWIWLIVGSLTLLEWRGSRRGWADVESGFSGCGGQPGSAPGALAAASSRSVNPYRVLGVARDADERTIKRRHRELVRIWHPDKSDRDDAEERFREITEAYEILTDSEKRRNYDRYGTPDPQQQRSPWRRGGRRGDGEPLPSAWSIELSYHNFQHYVETAQTYASSISVSSDTVWILMFYRTWDHDCKALAPVWDDVARRFAGVVQFARVNYDAQYSLTRQFTLRRLPTLMAFHGGQYTRYRGYLNARDIKTWVASFLAGSGAAPSAHQPVTVVARNDEAHLARVLSSPALTLGARPVLLAVSRKAHPSMRLLALAGRFKDQVHVVHYQARGDAHPALARLGIDRIPALAVVRAAVPASPAAPVAEAAVSRYQSTAAVADMARWVHAHRHALAQRVGPGNFDDVCGRHGSPCLVYVAVGTRAAHTTVADADAGAMAWALARSGRRGVPQWAWAASDDHVFRDALWAQAGLRESQVRDGSWMRRVVAYDRRGGVVAYAAYLADTGEAASEEGLAAWASQVVPRQMVRARADPTAMLLLRPTLAGGVLGTPSAGAGGGGVVTSVLRFLRSLIATIGGWVMTLVSFVSTLLFIGLFLCPIFFKGRIHVQRP